MKKLMLLLFSILLLSCSADDSSYKSVLINDIGLYEYSNTSNGNQYEYRCTLSNESESQIKGVVFFKVKTDNHTTSFESEYVILEKYSDKQIIYIDTQYLQSEPEILSIEFIEKENPL